MRTEQGPPRDADPVAELIRVFAASRGEHADAGTPVDELWRSLARRGDPAPGLSFAAWVAPAVVGGPLIPLLANSPDLRSLLTMLQQFHPLFGRDRIVVRTRGARASLTLVSTSGGPALADTVDACFGLLSRVVSDLTSPGSPTDRVLLRRPTPADPARHAAVFGTVVFGAGRDCCEFDAAALDTPIVRADPVMLGLLRPYAERRVADRAGPSTAAATGVLVAGDDLLTTIASRLGFGRPGGAHPRGAAVDRDQPLPVPRQPPAALIPPRPVVTPSGGARDRHLRA